MPFGAACISITLTRNYPTQVKCQVSLNFAQKHNILTREQNMVFSQVKRPTLVR